MKTVFLKAATAALSAANWNEKLGICLQKGDLAEARACVTGGADVNWPDPSSKNALLMLAALAGELETIAFCKTFLADPDLKNAAGQTAMHLTLEKSDFETAKALLKIKPDLTLQDGQGQTYLMLALSALLREVGKEEPEYEPGLSFILSMLKTEDSAHPFRDMRDSLGRTALYRCVEKLMGLSILLDKGCDFSIPDYNGVTPLMHAADVGNERALDQLLGQRNLNKYVVDLQGANVLHHALRARDANYNIVEKLVEAEFNVDQKDLSGRTPLMEAIALGDKDFALLLAYQTKVANKRDAKNKTALMEAAGHLLPNVIDILFQQDATLWANAQDDDDMTAALYAVSSKLNLDQEMDALSCLEALLEKGAKLWLKNKEGHTVLDLAKRNGLKKVVAFLEEKPEAFVPEEPFDEEIDESENSALIRAVSRLDVKGVKDLLGQGADPNFSGDEGRTPLITNTNDFMKQDQAAHDAITQLLLADPRIDVNKRDVLSVNALHLAIDWGHRKMTRRLIETGKADLDAMDGDEQTPLYIAAISAQKKDLVYRLAAAGATLDLFFGDEEKNVLMHAVEKDRESMVRFLVWLGADPDAMSQDGLSARSIAAAKPNKNMLNVLNKIAPAGAGPIQKRFPARPLTAQPGGVV